MDWLYVIGVYAAWFATISASTYIWGGLGGWVNAVLQSPNLIPVLGRYYHFLINRILGIQFLFSLTGIFVSTSGILLPFILLSKFPPFALSDDIQVAAALTAVTIVALRIMSAAWYMETWDYIALTMNMRDNLRLSYKMTRRQELELARTNFADTAVRQLLTITLCYGISLYCVSRLGWLGPAHRVETTFSGITEAVYFIRVLWGPQAYPTTLAGYVVHGFYGLSLLIYTALFISLASKLVDETVAKLPASDNTIASCPAEQPGDHLGGRAEKRWDHSFPRKQYIDRTPRIQ